MKPGQVVGLVDLSEQGLAVHANHLSIRLTCLLGWGKAIVFDALAVPVVPFGRHPARSHPGATSASTLSACRSVSPTSSGRFNVRTAASTCVESVRRRPRALIQPCAWATLSRI